MTKTAETSRPSTATSQSNAPFFDRKGGTAEASPAFFNSPQNIQPKLAMGKADDNLEQEADQVAEQVQAKLSVGAPDDPYETEADQVADKVVSQMQSSPSIQAKKEPTQRGREWEEGDQVFLKPASIQRLGEDIDGNGSRESVVAAARSMIGKIEAKHAEGGQRVGAKYLLEIFHLAAPGVWDDSIIQTAGATMPSWCGIFAVWAHKRAGKDIGSWQIGKGVSAFNTMQQTTSPQAGDIGYIDQPKQHHCIIVRVDGNNVHSIDGNSGLFSEVIENTRPMSAYSGFFTAFGAGGGVQRKSKIQRKGKGEASTAPASVEHSISATKGKGEQLPHHVQGSMGSAMGADFSDVRVHDDHTSAYMNDSLDAQAFTHGKDIYFNKGKYNPASKDGQHLLAHELTHTVQQGASAKRKMIQRNSNAPASATAADQKAMDKSVPPQFDPNGKTVTIEKIRLPDFKKRNSDKFKYPLHSLQPRPDVRDQREIWREFVQSGCNAKTADFLTTKQKTPDGVYFLKAKNSDFRIIGKQDQIQQEALIPKWNRFGKGNVHQVDHVVEFQLGGSNIETNYELTDKLANTDSGNEIKMERWRRMEAAIPQLEKKYPGQAIPSAKVMNSQYITQYNEVESWNLPYKGNGDVYWTMAEIKDGVHLQQLKEMSANEVKDSQGSDTEFVLYIRETSGSPMKIKLPYKGKPEKFLPGIELTDFTFTPGVADGEIFGQIKVTLAKNFTKRMKAGRPFTVNFRKKPFLINTGYLEFEKKSKGLEGILEFNGLSPIEIDEFGLDEKKGVVIEGNIITNIPIIDKTPISFSLVGEDFTVSKELAPEDVKDKFPKPFVVNNLSMAIFASSQRGLGVEGKLDFEVEKIGKGNLHGLAGTQDGFAIEGGFDFDPALFKSQIKASYIDKAFKFEGTVALDSGKLPGVKSLTIKVGYADDKLSGEGKAQLNIPGVKEIGIKVEQLEGGGIKIAGDLELGSKLKSDAKIQAVFENGEQGWDVSIQGKLDPNINIAGLEIKEVTAAFTKGVLDVSAKAHFEKGKIKGDFDLGVTNGALDDTGAKTATAGKELIFYANGEIKLTIAKDVEAGLKIRMTKEGDIFIGGQMTVSQDKSIVDGKKADSKSDPSLSIFSFKQTIPVASCGVASLIIELGAGVGLFYDFKGLTLDKGTNVTLEEINVKDINKAKITSDISLSTGVKAGVDAYISAKAGLQVLIAKVLGGGKVDLKLTAFDATVKAKVEAGFSADEGLQFKTAEMAFEVESKISYDIELSIELILDLFIHEFTLWEHSWKPDALQGEQRFSWFDGALKVPIKFGDNNSLAPEDVGSGLQKQIGTHARSEDTYMKGVKKGVNDEGPDPKQVEQEAEEKLKAGVAEAYRGAHSQEVFAFNSSINEEYFNTRIAAWNRLDKLKDLKAETKDLLKSEIMRYEREEYDAFVIYLKGETKFDEATKQLIIGDFFRGRPTLTAADKSGVDALVKPPDKPSKTPAAKKKDPVRRKELPGDGDHGFAIPDDFADRMENAKANGVPLPHQVQAQMGNEFGADFSQVKIHYDNEAIILTTQVNAQAFTHENHIFFNTGKFAPTTPEGKMLLAHELTHVLQQGQADHVQRKAETDAAGANYTGNYIFDPGKDGLNSGFFTRVKKSVADGVLDDKEIRALRADAIERNGTIMHAELLLMAAMRNPVNVAAMQKHKGGALIISMSNISDVDKSYLTNFDRSQMPPELAAPLPRLVSAFAGTSRETVTEAINSMDADAADRIKAIAGREYADLADHLIVDAGSPLPAIPLPEILMAMFNAASDSTPGDQVLAGVVYLIAKRAGHSMSGHLLNGTIKVDALAPSVYYRLVNLQSGEYNYSTDEDFSKANTLYLPTSTDSFSLSSRALVIHELTHAEDDIARPKEQLEDALMLERRAYEAQAKYFMDHTMANGSDAADITAGSAFVDSQPLFYWSMISAAHKDPAYYKTVLMAICSAAPASKNISDIQRDLLLPQPDILMQVQQGLLALRSKDGKQVYQPGKTRLGGKQGFYFQ